MPGEARDSRRSGRVGVFSSALVFGEPVGAAELAALALVVSGLAILVTGLSHR